MSLIVDIIFATIVLNLVILMISVHTTKKRMDRAEALRTEQRIFPRGSELCQGMVIVEGSKNGEVEDDSKCTVSWYSGLAK